MEHENFGVSILMPCLNEEKTVGVCVKKAVQFLEENGLLGEVLVVDNGSTDASATLARQAGAKVIFASEKGYGHALLAGMQAAEFPLIILGDSDDSYNFLEIKPFYDKLVEGADMVIGNRFAGGIAPGAMPFFHRYFGTPFLSWIGRSVSDTAIVDFHCGLRACRKQAVLSIGLCTGQMEFASEMIVKAAKNGLILEQQPCRLYRDKRGRPSHLRSIRDGFRHLFFLLHPAWFEK